MLVQKSGSNNWLAASLVAGVVDSLVVNMNIGSGVAVLVVVRGQKVVSLFVI